MCGLVGYIGGKAETQIVSRMSDAFYHRGPDSGDVWLDEANGVALGHRRLAIVDLSPAGQQPMTSSSGRFVIVFNGEIYNHMELRQELKVSWRGHSDTETLTAGFEAWGIAETVRRARGMFAFAVWDRHERKLMLARDRAGEKPLYYGFQNGVFLFASELKGLKAHPAFNAEIDRDALCLFLRYSAIGGAYSIYKGIHKLEPGRLLTLASGARTPQIETYWSGAQIVQEARLAPFQGSPEEAIEALELLLKDAVKSQMMSDVPLGAFLSGGVDSSLITALMQAQSATPVKTFSIGFTEALYDEAPFAKKVAAHLGTEHTEHYVTPEEAMQVIPRLPELYDEPFADVSQIPTFLVAQLARRHVTVSLSGDAGDELFAGYTRYEMTQKIWPLLARVPLPLRRMAAKGVASLPPSMWNRLGGLLNLSHAGDKIYKGASVLDSPDASALYLALVSHWRDPARVVLGSTDPVLPFSGKVPDWSGLGDVERMMAMDMATYLPDDILAKVDRAAMGVSLESRVPFLDPRVIAFAWRLPLAYKIRNGQSKWVLRQVLYRHVPKALIERPKTGFGVPIGAWLRGPLKTWAQDLLAEDRLKREGFFEPQLIRRLWDDHLSGSRDAAHLLWAVLMFEMWFSKNHQ